MSGSTMMDKDEFLESMMLDDKYDKNKLDGDYNTYLQNRIDDIYSITDYES